MNNITSKYKKLKLPDGTTIDEHRFIMQEHLGRKLNFNEVVHHINGNTYDNRIENLELKQRSNHSREHMTGYKPNEKTKEKLRNAPHFKGEEVNNHKLTNKDVLEIRIKLSQGYGVRELGRIYNIDHTTISRIKLGKAWKHVI